MEGECFPAISMNTGCGILSEDVVIKDEPTSESNSPQSSPHPAFLNHSDASMDTSDIFKKNYPSVLKHNNLVMKTPKNIFSQRLHVLKIEPGAAINLPPSSPSSSSSKENNEDITTLSQIASPSLHKNSNRVTLSSIHHTSTCRSISTPLISSQPKGSTGILKLTKEERRIRRKIKNTLSSRENRRKKKEYIDQLEREAKNLVSENSAYRKIIDNLEDSNGSLMSHLAKLQAIVTCTLPHLLKTVK